MEDGPRGRPGIVGRKPELAVLHEFLGADSPRRTFVLTGEAGIGKTALWEAGIEAARDRRLRVLSARPSSAEAKLSFAALADMLDDVDTDALAVLPAPQLRALEVALLRAEPTDMPAAARDRGRVPERVARVGSPRFASDRRR